MAAAGALTFKQCAEKHIAARRAKWKTAEHAQKWKNTLDQHAYPVMRDLQGWDAGLTHVMAVLEPMWEKTNETAVPLRGRIELVLDWAAAREMREGPNPAR